MDKNKNQLPQEGTDEYLLARDFQEDLDAHDFYITDFDAYEAMLISKVYDSVSKKTNNAITDGESATLAIERAARVVGQLPSGQMKAAGKKDDGKAALMDIVVQKWIYPNANAQHPFLEKIRLWQLYSSVYGFMPMFYDWNVTATGYIGPDCWLWNPRNFIPQAGRTNVDDMDYAHAIAYVGVKFLEDLLDEPESGGWDTEELKEVIRIAKEQSRMKDTSRDSLIDRIRTSSSVRQIAMVTRFESGKDGEWVTFFPDQGYREVRRLKNPHNSGRIPFIVKYCLPLMDNFYGLGDFQRNKPLQFAMDGLTNFYFQGLKTNIMPPFVVNANGVIKHTIDKGPDAVIMETIPNSVRRLETSTAGLSTYQAAMTQLKGALMSQSGTTDTTLNQGNTNDPMFGRTPQALKMNQARESTRDNQDRFYLESAVQQLIECMVALIPEVGTTAMPIDLFSDDIAVIQEAGYDDVMKMVKLSNSKTSGRLTINPKEMKGLRYRFHLDPGSTARQDKSEIIQNILDFLGELSKFPNALEQMMQNGKMPDFEYIFGVLGSLSGIPGVEHFFTQAPPPQPQPEPAPKDPSELVSTNFKDLPPAGKIQQAKRIGIHLTPEDVGAGLSHPGVTPPGAPNPEPTVAGTPPAPAGPAPAGPTAAHPEVAAGMQALSNLA
jgi:predicted nucleic acid-binding protein